MSSSEGTVRSWTDVRNGVLGIPADATHFRWSRDNAVRKKMCDGGQLYELEDVQDRPTTSVSGIVKIYPFIVEPQEGGADKVTPVVVKKPIGGGDPITWVVVEFIKPSVGDSDVVGHLTRMLETSARLNAQPTETLVNHNAALQKKVDELSTYISENDGGPIARFLNNNPTIVAELLKMAINWGSIIGEFLKVKLENEKRLAAQAMQNQIDVTPTGQGGK